MSRQVHRDATVAGGGERAHVRQPVIRGAHKAVEEDIGEARGSGRAAGWRPRVGLRSPTCWRCAAQAPQKHAA
eukprot:366338-Chlamydomonas_euryale.AAC.13